MGQRTNEKTASTRTDDMEQRMTRGIVWRSTIIFTLGENHFPAQAKYVESLVYLGSHFKIKAQCPPMPHNIHTFALNVNLSSSSLRSQAQLLSGHNWYDN